MGLVFFKKGRKKLNVSRNNFLPFSVMTRQKNVVFILIVENTYRLVEMTVTNILIDARREGKERGQFKIVHKLSCDIRVCETVYIL